MGAYGVISSISSQSGQFEFERDSVQTEISELAMVRRCFLHCEGTSPLYALPKSEPLRIKWLEFIFNSIPSTLPSIFLCPRHFTDSCFSNLGVFSAGFAKLLALREDAVPTLSGPMGEDITQDVSKHIILTFVWLILLCYVLWILSALN